MSEDFAFIPDFFLFFFDLCLLLFLSFLFEELSSSAVLELSLLVLSLLVSADLEAEDKSSQCKPNDLSSFLTDFLNFLFFP